MQKKRSQNRQVVTVHGLVMPAAWNNDGGVTRVSIATFDEDEYFLEDEEVAARLLGFLGKEVVIRGVLQEVDQRRILTQCSISQRMFQ